MDEETRRRYTVQSAWDGIALIAELIAAFALAVTLIGFRVSRYQFWLVGSAIALIVLLAAVTIIVSATT
ncbi:MAG TPA: hypothetical protein VHY10_02500 [Xanthobacteraceae bacterium]|jgi:membrane protein YdbS with pleckstrin-like domain|nr:hypothetical protein [Xanthobacteraceae bacterium]